MKYKTYSDEKTLLNLKSIMLSGQVSKIYLEDKTKNTLNQAGLRKQKVINLSKSKNKPLKLLIIPAISLKSTDTFCIKYNHNQLKWVLYHKFRTS